MIKHKYRNCEPFAICIGTIELAHHEAKDYYYITPHIRNTWGVKYKGYERVSCVNMTAREIEWFRANIHLFALTLSNDDGRIYEPKNQPNFRYQIKWHQRELF